MKILLACLALTSGLFGGCNASAPEADVRVMTYNVENLTTQELTTSGGRVDEIADIIVVIDPDILLINEIDRDAAARNAERLADRIEARGGRRYSTFFAPSNTGVHSGHDLDNNGVIDDTPGDRDYGGDALGYGEYPGQYAMALLVCDDLAIDQAATRTFRSTLWRDMPEALLPPGPDGSGGWYDRAELAVLPLSSKSHWDVPIDLPNGGRLHVLASHPTPPVFDGPEDRNGRRNHDEIRFWRDYLDDAAWIRDDRGVGGGLAADAVFVIVGDLNADPEAGDSRDDPIGGLLLSHPRVARAPAPTSGIDIETLRADATARFGLRVDHVLHSTDVSRDRAAVWRGSLDSPEASGAALTVPGDHFPVWADLRIGSEKGRRDRLPE